MVRRRHFCNQHEALMEAQSAAVARRKEERRRGLMPELMSRAAGTPSPAGGAVTYGAVLRDGVLGDATRLHRPMLSVCPVPGCSMLTMGGTCVEHDPPVVVTFPRGRPSSL
jgi:hypothetical protein